MIERILHEPAARPPAVTGERFPRTVLMIHAGGGIGGAPVSMLQLAAALPSDRYAPLAVFSHPGPILEFARTLGVPARVVPLRSAFFQGAHVPVRLRMLVNFSLHFWSTVLAARLLIRAERPDLVHLNTSVLIPAAIAAKLERVPLVWHVREVINTGSWVGRLEASVIARLADCIVANSSMVAQGFNGQGRVVRVHNAVDLHRFDHHAMQRRAAMRAELAIPPGAPVVGMVGSVQAVKGHYLLVTAARHVVEAVPEAVFLVVGGGGSESHARSWRARLKRALRMPLDMQERMRRMTEQCGLDSHFRFAGYRDDIAAAIAAMDVLAFPSLAPEGFGRPLIEAMAMARPVVASDIGPSREILGEGTGSLVPPGDPQALAAALVRFLTDVAAREEAGRRGRLRVESGFTLDGHVQAITTIYEDVLTRRQQNRTAKIGSPTDGDLLKARVAEFWDRSPCGSFASDQTPGERAFFEQVASYRDAAQPFMRELIGWDQFAGRRVLEVGCGLGTDLRQFAQAGARVVGVDLSARSVALARRQFLAFDVEGAFVRSDAERLPFPDHAFDAVYSFGVLHHTPNTQAAITECYRVLRPGGQFILMLYNSRSWHVVVEPHLLRLKYWLQGRPVEAGFTDAREVVRRYDGAANPLGKAFTPEDVRGMLSHFADVRLQICHSRAVDGSWFLRTYGRALEWSGINRRWGFWIVAQARRPVELA